MEQSSRLVTNPITVCGSVVFKCYSFVGFCNCSMFCCAFLCAHHSFAIIFMGMRELVGWFFLSS